MMIYVLLGEDSLAKDHKIAELKAKTLRSAGAVAFDYIVLHAVKLDAQEFKKVLFELPAVAPQRFIVLRTVQKLSAQNKKIFLEFMEQQPGHAVVVLDSGEAAAKDEFISRVSARARVLRFQTRPRQNVFDMTKSISACDPTRALKILNDLLSDGNPPLQIMGGLVWFWGKTKQRLSQDTFKEGLLELQEADLNIKRSRLKAEHALEIVVVKLCSLLAC
jgi:DNA polymerase III delta subunit